ncbi:unnamed protein product [Rhizophagus irregularis]|uniref:Serine-threonine/tyrosine-protein kinase catalytic domain-containing protein n=1 Tax=Rhizophagus irregularis TaxID=588596 RepID=A0A916EJR0_9GLOM|nr:unnamed protein product [Rhizophagus irregularis]
MCHLFLSEVIYSVKENYGITQNPNTKDYIQPNTKVALKCLNNSQNFLDEFINEVKAYTNQKIDNILKIYGISQNTNTKEYIMVLEYAEGDFNSYLKDKCEDFDWYNGLNNRPNSIELKESIDLFYNSLYRLNQHFEISIEKEQLVDREIEKQFNKTQEYRKENFLSIKNNQLTSHTQAIYTSRLLNSFTKDLPKYEDNFNSNTVEITDFTNL